MTQISNNIPQDKHLKDLPAMLNCDNVKSLLSQYLYNAYGDITECKISYLRYKPGVNCIIAYTASFKKRLSERQPPVVFYAKVYTSDDYHNAVNKAQQHRWIKQTDMKPFIALPEHHTLLYFFPNDCALDGLRVLSNFKKIQRILYEHFNKYDEQNWRISDRRLRIATVRYKPERRAVLRCFIWAKNRLTNKKRRFRIYMRIYGDDRGSSVYSIQKKLYRATKAKQKPIIPKPIVYLPDRKLLLMKALKGVPLIDRLTKEDRLASIVRTAQALACLHGCKISDVYERLVDNHLDDALSTTRMLQTILPENSVLIEKINSSLHKLKASDDHVNYGFVHGDFYYGQVLIDDNSTGLIDFDRSYTGDVIADIGNFCAHLRLLSLERRIKDAKDLEHEFINAYENLTGNKISDDRLRFWIAFGLFQLAIGPFRRFESEWGKKSKAILDECGKILEC